MCPTLMQESLNGLEMGLSLEKWTIGTWAQNILAEIGASSSLGLGTLVYLLVQNKVSSL